MTDRAVEDEASERGDCSTSFCSSTQDLLRRHHLLGATLVKVHGDHGTKETVSWSQLSRCWWGCSEKYTLYSYRIYGASLDDPEYMVHVAHTMTAPESFTINQNTFSALKHNRLYMGNVIFDKEGKVLFFVMHPNDWYPFQKRFRTSEATAKVHKTVQKLAGKFGKKLGKKLATIMINAFKRGALMGSVIPGKGTVAFGVLMAALKSAPAVSKFISKELADNMSGDYLRYIG